MKIKLLNTLHAAAFIGMLIVGWSVIFEALPLWLTAPACLIFYANLAVEIVRIPSTDPRKEAFYLMFFPLIMGFGRIWQKTLIAAMDMVFMPSSKVADDLLFSRSTLSLWLIYFAICTFCYAKKSNHGKEEPAEVKNPDVAAVQYRSSRSTSSPTLKQQAERVASEINRSRSEYSRLTHELLDLVDELNAQSVQQDLEATEVEKKGLGTVASRLSQRAEAAHSRLLARHLTAILYNTPSL